MVYLDGKGRDEAERDAGQWLASSGEARVAPDALTIPWPNLTKSADKQAVFEVDPEFRLIWSELGQFMSDRALNFASEYGIVLFKPEAICRRDSVLQAIRLCKSAGFMVVSCTDVALTPQTTSLIWRYQLNRATLNRLRALFLMFELRGAMALLLRRPYDHGMPPCSVALSQIKGSGFRERMRADTLRGVFDPLTPLINFVHVSDEPADIVRELAILFPRAMRMDVYRNPKKQCSDSEIEQALAIAEANTEFSDIDPERALQRLRSSVMTTEGRGGEHRVRLLEYFAELESFSTYLDVEIFLDLLDKGGVSYTRWDALLVAARFMVRTHDGMKELVGKVDPKLWGGYAGQQ